MQNVNIYKVNDSVTQDTVPEHQMTRLTGEQEQVVVEQLCKPIKCR